MAALSGGDKPHATPSDSGGTSSSSVSKPSSLSFGVPAAAPSAPGAAPAPTPTLGPRTQARTGARMLTDTPVSAAAAAADSVSSSSVQASLHSVGYGSTGAEQAVSSEADDAAGPVSRGLQGPQLVGRGLAASGRVSTELTRSSSATSEELEQLLHQLSQYEEHLMEEAQALGGLPPDLDLQQQQQQHAEQPSGRGEVDISLDSSLSWSQTLAGLRHLLPPDSNA